MTDTTTDLNDTPPPGWRGYCYPSCSPTALAMAQDAALALVQRYTMDAHDMMEHPEGAWVYMDEVRRRLNEANPTPRKLRVLARLPDGTTHELPISGDGACDGNDMVLVDIQPSMVNVSLPDLQILGRAPDGSDHQLEIYGYSYNNNRVLVRLPGESVPPGQILNKDRIREIFLAHGFTIKEGQTDLKQYVYDAAEALLREAALQLGIMTAQRLNRELSADTILADLMRDWKTGVKSSQDVCVEFFQHFSSTPALGALDRYQDHGQQRDEPTGPNHPGHHDGQTCEQAAQAQVDLHEMLYPGSQAREQYKKEYSQFANSEYGSLNGWRPPYTADELIDFIGPHFMSLDVEGDKESRRVMATIHDLRSMFNSSGAYDAADMASRPVAWMCPNDPDAGSAFKWAKPGVDYSGLSCSSCQAKHVPVFRQATGQVYGIIDPDYGRIYTIVRKLAWEEGYAIGLHGSFTRDLDMVAVPWDAGRRCNPEKLVARILQATGLKEAHGNPGIKPHGRKVWTLLLPEFGDPRFVDLSIMPCPDIQHQPTEGVSNE